MARRASGFLGLGFRFTVRFRVRLNWGPLVKRVLYGFKRCPDWWSSTALNEFLMQALHCNQGILESLCKQTKLPFRKIDVCIEEDFPQMLANSHGTYYMPSFC